MRFKLLLAFYPMLKDFIRFDPLKILCVLVLMVLSGFTSGFSILMIVPLLSAVGIVFDDVNSMVGASQLAPSGPIQSIVDAANTLGIPLTLGYILCIYLTIILVINTTNYLSTVVSADLQKGFVKHTRNLVFKKLLYAEWRFLNNERMTDFVRMATAQVEQVGASIHQVLVLAGQLVIILIYLLLAFMLSPTLTGMAILCSVGLITLLLPLNQKIYQSGQTELTANRQMFNDVIEQLANLKVIKSFAAESQYLNKMGHTSDLLENQQLKMTSYNALVHAVNLSGGAVIFSLLLYVAIQHLGLPLTNLLVMLFIFSRLMPKISLIQKTFQRLIHLVPDYMDLQHAVEKLNKHSENITDTDINRPEFHNDIKLESVSYQYPDQASPAFSGLSTIIKKNQTCAIIGPSGTGKSTLADIISGLIEPSSGHMLIDGRPLELKSRIRWRKKVAYVTQDVFLFHDSIKANLAWVLDRSVADTEIWQALEMAAIDEYIQQLPKGLETLIGDRGIKLSGGERQRLALARALICKPEILILDEATSALDRQNELNIRDSLVRLQGQLTIIIIAHNKTTIEHVEKHIHLG